MKICFLNLLFKYKYKKFYHKFKSPIIRRENSGVLYYLICLNNDFYKVARRSECHFG